MHTKEPDLERISRTITEDMPVRLDIIAAIAFPDGTISAKSLRYERDKGHLKTEMIAGKEYTTLAEIKKMRELCQIDKKASDSGSGRNRARQTGQSATKPDMSSSTTEGRLALAAALQTLQKLKRNSPTTSPPSTTNNPPPRKGTVIPLK